MKESTIPYTITVTDGAEYVFSHYTKEVGEFIVERLSDETEEKKWGTITAETDSWKRGEKLLNKYRSMLIKSLIDNELPMCETDEYYSLIKGAV